jgi:hypothetical protein
MPDDKRIFFALSGGLDDDEALWTTMNSPIGTYVMNEDVPQRHHAARRICRQSEEKEAHRRVFRMAEEDRAIAEGSASWNLQSGMGLHLRGRGLQLSPYEESGDSSNVSRGRSVLAGPKMNPRDTSGCSKNPSRITK